MGGGCKKRERKGREVGVLKGWQAGFIGDILRNNA